MHVVPVLLLSVLIGTALTADAPRLSAQGATVPPAQAPAAPKVKVTEDKPGLLARARVNPDLATATALARVPGGVVKAGEIEEEGGKLIYSFDIKVAGKRGIEEVHVDAMTGALIKSEHEDDAAEPTAKPASSRTPIKAPIKAPTRAPTKAPTSTPTKAPTDAPTTTD